MRFFERHSRSASSPSPGQRPSSKCHRKVDKVARPHGDCRIRVLCGSQSHGCRNGNYEMLSRQSSTSDLRYHRYSHLRQRFLPESAFFSKSACSLTYLDVFLTHVSRRLSRMHALVKILLPACLVEWNPFLCALKSTYISDLPPPWSTSLLRPWLRLSRSLAS